MPTTEFPLSLLCHPITPAPVVRAIDAQAFRRSDGTLLIAYRLWGDMARLRIPEQHSAERTDFLWEHTCFEAFIGIPGESAYREFNFSPSSQWAAYAFSDYRQRDEGIQLDAAALIATQRFAGRLELHAILAPEVLPRGASAFQIGLSAVIEAADVVDGAHSYWSLRHPAERPDFHHRAAFALTLSASDEL